MYNGSKEVKGEANHREEVLGNTGATNRAKGVIQKGNSKGKPGGYFGKMNLVSGRRNSPRIVT